MFGEHSSLKIDAPPTLAVDPRWFGHPRSWSAPRPPSLLVLNTSHKMPKAAKLKWGTNPAVKFGKTSDPLNAKGRLTELFQSGEIDVNNWTTKFLAVTYPDIELTRFPESTVRTHCSKVCAEVIHQRGLDQQARLLGRNNNNNAAAADDDEEEEEEVEEEAPNTPPDISTHSNHSTPNRRSRMSTSSRASSRRGSRHVDADGISELADRFSSQAKIPFFIDNAGMGEEALRRWLRGYLHGGCRCFGAWNNAEDHILFGGRFCQDFHAPIAVGG